MCLLFMMLSPCTNAIADGRADNQMWYEHQNLYLHTIYYHILLLHYEPILPEILNPKPYMMLSPCKMRLQMEDLIIRSCDMSIKICIYTPYITTYIASPLRTNIASNPKPYMNVSPCTNAIANGRSDNQKLWYEHQNLYLHTIFYCITHHILPHILLLHYEPILLQTLNPKTSCFGPSS